VSGEWSWLPLAWDRGEFMRKFATVALLGSALSIAGVQARAQHKEDPLAEWGPEVRRAKSESRRPEPGQKEQKEPAEAAKAQPAPAAPPVPASVQRVDPAPPLEFPAKEVTPQEVSRIKVGAIEREVLLALGTPSSRVAIPDDDGHLRETWQYWVKGRPIATLRLDNRRVVKIEVQTH
jgi:hypothetical protein